MLIRLACCLFFLSTVAAIADEQVRQIQEELRRRNLYFGDVDGQASSDLANALKRYQTRKGFSVTGTIDDETATSLNVRQIAAVSGPVLPDVPVLKSDSARELPETERLALETFTDENPDAVVGPPPPSEAPPPSQDNITPARVNQLVEQYLRDGEGTDIAAQVKYFAYPLDYFDHGSVGAAFVQKDVGNYVKRWPERKYVLTDPVSFVATGTEGELTVEFPIAFSVRNKSHVATGRTRNIWTVRTEGDALKIVAIREQRLRE